jgi:four helix bundle protein
MHLMTDVPGVSTYTDLVVWQLANELRVTVLTLTARRPFSTDFKRRAQLEDAIDSVCRNVAEGFGCGSDPGFAHYLEIARGSLFETTDAIRSARLRGHISDEEAQQCFQLANRLKAALNGFIDYLRRCRRPDKRRALRTDER